MLSPEQRRTVLSLHAQGLGSRRIAERLNLSRHAVRRIIDQGPKADSHPAKPEASLTERIRSAIARTALPLDALCDVVHEGPTAVKTALSEMQGNGVQVREAADGWRIDLALTPTEMEYRTEETPNRIRVGFVSDTHLCSKAEDLDALNRAYDAFAKAGVQRVLHHGDIVDGFGVYRGQEFEVKVAACDEQVAYVAENYPRRDGITTEFITGNHDLAYAKRGGHDPGPQIASLRPDLKYLGRYAAWVELAKGVWHYMLHPDKGGAYALSYKPQRMVEAWTRKPNVADFGHWHQCGYFQTHGVHTLLAGCFQRQTEYMRRLGLEPVLGAWLIEMELDGPRIVAFRPEWIACA